MQAGTLGKISSKGGDANGTKSAEVQLPLGDCLGGDRLAVLRRWRDVFDSGRSNQL